MNRYFHGTLFDPSCDLDPPSRWRILAGIGQQVGEHLHGCAGISEDERKIRWHIELDRRLRVVTHLRGRADHDRPQVARSEIQPLKATLHSLEVEEVIYQGGQALALDEDGFEILMLLGLR